jgi:hypothetical protein
VRLSRYFVVLCAVWVVTMTWRLYPHFGDTLRVNGRPMVLDEYVAANCIGRVGPEAARCSTAAKRAAQPLIAREQAKSLLLIEAPLLGYLLVYLPAQRALRRLPRQRDAEAPAATEEARGGTT